MNKKISSGTKNARQTNNQNVCNHILHFYEILINSKYFIITFCYCLFIPDSLCKFVDVSRLKRIYTTSLSLFRPTTEED